MTNLLRSFTICLESVNRTDTQTRGYKIFSAIEDRMKNLKMLYHASRADRYARFLQNNIKAQAVTLRELPATTDETRPFLRGLPATCSRGAELAQLYSTADIAGSGDTWTRTLRLLDWLSDHTFYCGIMQKLLPDDSVAILRYAYDKPFTHAINCRQKALAFADLLDSVGIIAEPLQLVRADFENDKLIGGGCHFMVHVWLKEENRWVAVDPSFHTYFTQAERPLDIIRLREALRKNQAFRIVDYQFNGTQQCFDLYRSGFVTCCDWIGVREKDPKPYYIRKRLLYGINLALIPDEDCDRYAKMFPKYDGWKDTKRISIEELLFRP